MKAAVVLVLVLLAMACTSYVPTPTVPTPTAQVAPTPDLASPDTRPATYGELWLLRLSKILQGTSPFQAAILADGRVTAEEHVRAQTEFFRCIDQGGGRITELERDESGRVLLLGVGLRANPLGDAAPLVDECRERFYSDVEWGWYVALHFNESEQDTLNRTAECAIASGYNVPPSPASFQELLEAAEALDGPQPQGHHGPARERLLECNTEVQ